MNVTQNLLDNINTLTSNRGMTWDLLSKEIGLPKNAIAKWNKGKAKPEPEDIFNIAKYFDVTTDWLFTGLFKETPLSPYENMLLFDYKMLNKEGKDYIHEHMRIANKTYREK